MSSVRFNSYQLLFPVRMASYDTNHFDAQISDVIRKVANVVSDSQNSIRVHHPLVDSLETLVGPMLEIPCSVVELQSHSDGTQCS